MKEFKEILKEKRIEKKLSQANIAKLINVPLRTWQDWEYGKRIPDAFKQQAIIEKLNKKRIVKINEKSITINGITYKYVANFYPERADMFQCLCQTKEKAKAYIEDSAWRWHNNYNKQQQAKENSYIIEVEQFLEEANDMEQWEIEEWMEEIEII